MGWDHVPHPTPRVFAIPLPPRNQMTVRMKHRLPSRHPWVQPHIPAADRGVLGNQLLTPLLQQLHHGVPLRLVQRQLVLPQHLATALQRADIPPASRRA